MSHKGTKGEPQAVEYAKLVGRLIGLDLPIFILLGVPLIRTEAADQEQHHTDTDVGKNNTHPDLVSQWIQEREDTWFGFLRLLDHDRDSQRHEGFGEVDHLLSYQSDGQRSHCNVGFLSKQKTKVLRMKTVLLEWDFILDLDFKNATN